MAMNIRTILLAVFTLLLLSESGLSQRPPLKETADIATRKAQLGDIKEDRGYDEIRLWFLQPEDSLCYVIRKGVSGFQAVRLDVHGKKVRKSRSHSVTFSNFEKLWKRLDAFGAFAIPDSSKLKGGEARVLDGFDVLVQYRKGSIVGSYAYSNPLHQPWPEAKKALKVLYMVADAFNAEGIKSK